ncbi:MAG: divergent polysaccharide deacetylase family protein [Desulfuromonadales bacterium]|nr:divergent polysaccharide deacetylase family protein [Desulfuromonadales bacterium]
MSRKSKKTKRQPAAPDRVSHTLQLLMAVVVLTILSLGALYLVRGPVDIETPAASLTDDLAVEIESVLLRSGYTIDQIDIQSEPGLLHYNVSGVLPEASVLDRLESRLQTRFPGIVDDRNKETGEVLIYRKGALVAVIQFEAVERPLTTPPFVDTVPKIAIIMDDLGRSLTAAKKLIALDLSVTLSILPGEPLATEVALLASRSGQEVMIHIPMEPQSYPEADPGQDALLLGQSEQEVHRRLVAMIKKVPYASGANNHMGSRYTEYQAGMHTVIATMREYGLFFVDSRTTSRSVVKQEALRVGVPTTVRDVFLDNVAEVEAIRIEIRRLVKRAKQNGSAVGICHPYPETIEALRLEQESLQDRSIEMVFASKLVTL